MAIELVFVWRIHIPNAASLPWVSPYSGGLIQDKHQPPESNIVGEKIPVLIASFVRRVAPLAWLWSQQLFPLNSPFTISHGCFEYVKQIVLLGISIVTANCTHLQIRVLQVFFGKGDGSLQFSDNWNLGVVAHSNILVSCFLTSFFCASKPWMRASFQFI